MCFRPIDLERLEKENISLSVEQLGIDADARLKNCESFVKVR